MNDYCVPDNEFEWRDILLKCGCSKDTMWRYPYSTSGFIWSLRGVAHPLCPSAKPGPGYRMTTDAFLEKYRTDKPKAADSVTTIENRLHALEVKSALFDDILKRLTKLESNSLSPVAIQHLVQMGDTRERLSALEARLDKETSDTSSTGATWGCCSISINPKASPKNIPFSVALEYMKCGRRVRQKRFATEWYWTISGNEVVDADGRRVFPSPEMPLGYTDIVGNEWEVIEEKP